MCVFCFFLELYLNKLSLSLSISSQSPGVRYFLTIPSKRHLWCLLLCFCVRVSGSVVDSPPHQHREKTKGRARCRNFVAPIFHLAWHKRVRFTCACREVLNLPLSSVGTFENLLKGLLHLFVIFFDDMIEQKKVTQKSHVRFLCRGLLWTVFEEEAYFRGKFSKGGTARGASSRDSPRQEALHVAPPNSKQEREKKLHVTALGNVPCSR